MAHPSEIVQLGKATFLLVILLLLFSWITVALRMWVRLRITKSPGWDDAAMVFTLCLFTCYCAFILVIILASAAERRFTVMEVLQTLAYIQLGEVFYILTTTFLKISLGLFFLRLLTKPWQRQLFHAILAVSAIYGFFYFMITIFQCGNPAKLADTLLGSKRCAPTWFLLTTGYLYGIVNVVADWTFTLIPIVVLMDSDMDRRSKISVGIVMGFAAIGSISSILRMVYLRGLLFSGHVSANSIRATIWATAEPGTGIIAASGAILRPLFRQISTDVRDKISAYGSSKSSRDRTNADSESVIGLTTVATSKRTNSLASKKDSAHSANDRDPWDERISMERGYHVEIGVGKAVSIRTASGDVPPVPPKKP